MIIPPLTALILATQLIVTVADEVPKLDVTATCRAESNQAPSNMQACMKDEQSARDQLIQQWRNLQRPTKLIVPERRNQAEVEVMWNCSRASSWRGMRRICRGVTGVCAEA